MSIIAVIPSRYASTRLPGKPLADICGKPMIQHVYERVRQAGLFDEVIVATDDARIAAAVQGFGGGVCMTSPDCPSGSDRLIEAANAHPADIYVNVQGDEPLVEPGSIVKLARAMLDDGSLQMATLCYPVSAERAADPNLVKVVRAHSGNALYFSRSPIPFPRSGGIPAQYFGHLGIYAYRRELLMRFGSLPSPCREEALAAAEGVSAALAAMREALANWDPREANRQSDLLEEALDNTEQVLKEHGE